MVGIADDRHSVWSVEQQIGLSGIILVSVTGIAGSLFSRQGLRNRLLARRLQHAHTCYGRQLDAGLISSSSLCNIRRLSTFA